jgi:hypothetical protein
MNDGAIPDLAARLENIRYLALDMDGTLLPDDKTIPDFTYSVLCEARAAGYKLCICSGRSFAGVYKYERLRDIISYYVCFEGGYIIDNTIPSAPSLIHSRCISPEEAAIIAGVCQKSGAMLAFLTNKEGFCLNCDEDIFKSVKIWGAVPRVTRYDELGALLSAGDIYIALVYGNRGQIDFVWDNFSKEAGVRFDAINTYLDFKDLHHLVLKAPGTNKWNGIARVLELNGVDAENLIAFGDWHNDFEMIKNAGVGVAMKNADTAIIEAALVITSHDNNDEGVARFIREKLLKIVV